MARARGLVLVVLLACSYRAPAYHRGPVRVGVDPRIAADYGPAMAAAVTWWNAELGCRALVFDPRAPQIVARPDTPHAGEDITLATGSTKGDIRILRMTAPDIAYDVLRHELGHALGAVNGKGCPWEAMDGQGHWIDPDGNNVLAPRTQTTPSDSSNLAPWDNPTPGRRAKVMSQPERDWFAARWCY